MKKNLLSSILTVCILCTATISMSAQTNLLPSSFFGFEETAPTGWWINPASSPYTSLSTDQAASGSYSLKFDFDYSVLSAGSTTVNVESTVSNGAKVTLTAGTYLMKIKVYVVDNPPAILKTIFASPWKQVDWDLTNVEVGKWVYLMQNVILTEDLVDDKLVVQIFKSTFSGMTGTGSFLLMILKYLSL